MDNLTLEHLSAYLPYGLEITFEGDEYIHSMVGVEDTTNGIILISIFNDYGRCDISKVKPLLRPLSQLTQEIVHKGERFVPYYWFGRQGINIKSVKDERWHIVQKLISWHFDVFGLIDKGLAIDINTL